MLNIGKLAHGGAEYYLTSVASSLEAYYTGAGEAPGRWVGATAHRLGLSGLVTAETLRAVLAGTDPADGGPLVGAGRTVPGFDLTFRAPKSVSLLWALADDDISLQVREAHDSAVGAALDYLQREAAFTRTGKGGTVQVPVEGFVAAAFRHRTSRADDPLLHTHILVANLAHTDDDGQWRSLDARHLYLHAKTAGYLYQAQLRAELGRTLGVRFEPVVNGHADIDGVPRPVIEAFSRRRADILAALDQLGHDSARAAQIATLTTRTAKTHADADGLRVGWRQRAADLGLHRRHLDALTTRPTDQQQDLEPLRDPVGDRELVGHAGWLLGPAGLTARASTFTRRDTLQGWCSRLTGGADVTEVERLADRLLDDTCPGTLRLTGPASHQAAAGGPGIRLADGRIVAAGPAEARYTTPELLATERRLLDTAVARLNTGRATAPSSTVESVLAGVAAMTGEQRHAVRQLTSTGHGVEVLVGRAGTGKTITLGVARQVWEQAGIEVVGCALAARAARELQTGSGIASSTIDRLLGQLSRHGATLPAGGVLVVDEAGMVGTRTLARLVDAAGTAGTKLVLVGDHHQLPEIDAGGTFRGLVARLPAIELTDNRRQHRPWEIDALDQLRHGDVTAAIDAYDRHDRVHTAATAAELHEQLVGDWWQAVSEHGLDAVMVAARHTDLDALNAAARTRMAVDGQLTGEPLEAAERLFQVGDRVLCLRNHHRLGVLNGSRGTVTAIDHHTRTLTVDRDDDRGRVVLPAGYLDAGRLTHGYALTAHKAQGLTCDATFVLGSDDIYREWGYVAMSRGRTDNRLYLTSSDLDRDEPADDPTHPEFHQHDPRTPTERLTADLHRSHRQMLACDHLPASQPADTTARVVDVEGAAGGPAFLVRALGPRPADDDGRRRWDAASDQIAAYRTAHGVHDEDRPLGLVPADPDQRDAYRQAMRELLATRRALRPPAPADRGEPTQGHGIGRDVA